MDGRREVADAVAVRFRVIHQPRSRDALESARRHQPDIIVVGDEMEDSIHVCGQIHADFWRVPLIGVSLSGDQKWLKKLVAIGIDDFLFGQFTPEELEIRIANLMRNCLYRNELRRKNEVLRGTLEDLKETEANLVQAEKLSQLGEMIAGIVHEINNPLNYSHTGIYVLRELSKSLDDGRKAEFSEVLADVTEGLDRVNHIVRDLRNFATRSRANNSDINLAASVQTSARLLGHKLGSLNVLIDVPENLFVFGNENKYCQVIVNLIKNGVEATEDAGRGLENSQIRVVAKALDSAVELRIRDNGCGIPADQLARIFSPFFSTKQSEKGMGLGLSICRKIMEEYGGSITAVSEEGSFTEFILTFPRAAHLVAEALGEKPPTLELQTA